MSATVVADLLGVKNLMSTSRGELPTNRERWLSSPQFFQWINPLLKSHVNHGGYNPLTKSYEPWVVRHQEAAGGCSHHPSHGRWKIKRFFWGMFQPPLIRGGYTLWFNQHPYHKMFSLRQYPIIEK